MDEKSAHGARDLTHKRIEVELYNEGHTAEAGRTWATWVTEHGAPNLQYSPYKKKVPQCMAYFIMKKEACFAHGAPTHQDGPG